MTIKLLLSEYEALERAKDSEDLHAEMEKFAKEIGFERFAYALTIDAPSLKPQQYILNGYPQEWVDRYLSSGYFKVDPLVRHAENSSLPAIWDEQNFHDESSNEFWEEARKYGLCTGISFAIHEQPGSTAIFSLARDKPLDLPGNELAALIGRAQIFASLLHHAVSRIDLPKLIPQRDVRLTAREQECLKWAADGKTAWEIGKILNIAERTAVFHVNNVIQKLGASNKTQAIVRAVVFKLV